MIDFQSCINFWFLRLHILKDEILAFDSFLSILKKLQFKNWKKKFFFSNDKTSLFIWISL